MSRNYSASGSAPAAAEWMLRRTGSAHPRRGRCSLARAAAAAVCWIALALGGAPAHAEIKVEAHLDRNQMAIGDQVTLTVTVHGSGDAQRPELPELPDFRVFPAGSSRNFSFVNGRMASAT